MSSIKITNLNVKYGNQVVLHDISLVVAEGSFVSIVGPSGSGKSTLLNAMAGFLDAAPAVTIPDDIGVVFQKDGVLPFMTVRENILFALHSSKVKMEKAQDLLESTGLTACAERYPSELSGGQVQRLNFARALASQPSVLLCDEPFSSLDEITRNSMQGWLMELGMKCTVVLVTHSIEEAIFLSDQIIVLNDGRLRESFEVSFRRPRGGDLRFSREFIELRKNILSCF